MQGRTHYATISEDDFAALTTLHKCEALSKKYGVNGTEVWRQICCGNRSNHTFPIFFLVPHLLSEEEVVGDIEELKRIVRERELDGRKVAYFRKKIFRRHTKDESAETSDSEAEPCELPPAPPQPIPSDALARVYATRTTACFGLHLLTTVQAEDAAVLAGALPHDVGARAHLRRLPMSALHRVISELWQVRETWERELLAPCAAALAGETAHTAEERLNAFLFHVCLWQRRYPLELLRSVLSFYDGHRENFLPADPSSPCEPFQVEQLLEELLRLYGGDDLAQIPGLLRCDVLMSYPTMPLAEQTELMHRVAESCKRGPAIASAGTTTAGAHAACASDALYRHSRSAMDPQQLLVGFTATGVRVPPRFCAGMSNETYRQLRRAFERHKQDGVRRLATQEYPQMPPHPPAASHFNRAAQGPR